VAEAKVTEVLIDHSSTTMCIAIAQIEGPRPSGKVIRPTDDGRETYGWNTLEDMRNRISKACAIMRSLAQKAPRPHLIVFPEYSLPIEFGMERLRAVAEECKLIVVTGGDNIRDRNTGRIYNRAAILIPGRQETLWASKRILSQWEAGYLDEPPIADVPIVKWRVQNKEYWIRFPICLDFLVTAQDPGAFHRGGGIYVTPMCSPDIATFRVMADALLRVEEGTATILCNCVGQDVAGGSSVVAVVPDRRPLKPAIELSDREEGIAIVQIDCANLAPAKKTPVHGKWPLASRVIYDVELIPGGLQLLPGVPREQATRLRAVINPNLFAALGKRMRIAFLSFDNFADVIEKTRNRFFESQAILGQHDLMVTHLHEDLYNLIYEIAQVMPPHRIGVSSDHSQQDFTNDAARFAHFEVTVFYKVLGITVDEAANCAFRDPELPLPSKEELMEIFALGHDWEDASVAEESRSRYQDRRWILGYSQTQPGAINAVMTISISQAVGQGIDLRGLLAEFERHVMPALLQKNDITSIYGGTGHLLVAHYILRLRTSAESLFDLIDEIHRLAQHSRLLLKTSTYVVMKRLSEMPLDKACLRLGLPDDDAFYLNTHLMPKLNPEEVDKALYLEDTWLQQVVTLYRAVDESLKKIRNSKWFRDELPEFEHRVIAALLAAKTEQLKEPHGLLQGQVEKRLRKLVEQKVPETELDGLQRSLGMPTGKNHAKLTYGELVKIARHLCETGKASRQLCPILEPFSLTVDVRNALEHTREGEVKLSSCIKSICLLAQFLEIWEFPSED